MNHIFLMAPQAGAAQGGGNGYMNFVMIGLIGVVFYFFMIRPQSKRAKDQKLFIEEMKKGDKVVTTGGMHGKITDVNDTDVQVEVANGVTIRFEKSAISVEMTKVVNAK